VQAKRTELLIGVILGLMLLGLSVLIRRFGVAPRAGDTVLSQVMGIAVGRHWAYFVVSVTITLVLALAANTSFEGLPVLTSLLARDSYLPHLFSLRGDRQVFSNGILVLGVFAGALLVAVGGNTNTLIPLFAIGVFTAFTLSQSGLVVHWRTLRPPHWRLRAAVNGLGALVTGTATLVFLFTKFTGGAWVVVVAVPSFIVLFVRIRRYYDRVGSELGIGRIPPKPHGKRTQVIVPVTSVSLATERALEEALALGDDVVALAVAVHDDEVGQGSLEALRRDWAVWDPGVPLVVLQTEYSSVVEPIVAFIDAARRGSDHQIVVLIPVIVPDRLRHRVLHNHLDVVLASALRRRTDVVVARVPMSVDAGPGSRPGPGDEGDRGGG
jgi:hypothetical protein